MHTSLSQHFSCTYILRRFLQAAILLSVASVCWAASEDTKQPINIEADRMQYDNANKISRFSGTVVAKQGTLVIRAAEMEVREDAAGNQLGVATGTQQRRAFFRQDRDNTNEHIEGEANRLEYDSRTGTLKLVGNATVRRYRNNQLWDQSSGGVITYNDVTSFFTVESGKNDASSSGRVTSVFVPEPSKK